MIRKIIPFFTATAVSMGITFVVPVGITTVSSFTFVTEAQAFGYKSFKKSVKKRAKKTANGLHAASRGLTKASKSTKDFVTCKNCPKGKWIDPDAIGRTLGKTGKIGDPRPGTKGSHDHRS
jgi:hypothetical protein